jgi:hypothetical protein
LDDATVGCVEFNGHQFVYSSKGGMIEIHKASEDNVQSLDSKATTAPSVTKVASASASQPEPEGLSGGNKPAIPTITAVDGEDTFSPTQKLEPVIGALPIR